MSDCIFSKPEDCVPCPSLLLHQTDKLAEEQKQKDELEIIQLKTQKRRTEILEKREEEIKQEKHEIEIKRAKEFATKHLVIDIAHRIERGESITSVLACIGANSKTINSKSIRIANQMRKKKRQKEIQAAAAEQERRYRVDERTARLKGTYRPPHGTLYWLAQIAFVLAFIGMVRATWKCLNMTNLIKEKYHQIVKYVIVATCCETRKCVPRETVSTYLVQ